MRYVIAYAGNTWEVFAIRVWFVPFLAFNAGLNGNPESVWAPPVLAGISALIAVPVSLRDCRTGFSIRTRADGASCLDSHRFAYV